MTICKIKVSDIEEGLIPSERCVAVNTVDGKEELWVHHTSLDRDQIEVLLVSQRENRQILVELPRETASGRKRVWISEDQLAGIITNG